MGQGLLDRNSFLTTGTAHSELLALRNVTASADRRQQVDHKGKNVAREDEGDRPFQNRTGILFTPTPVHADAKANGKTDFDDNESKFDEETGQQHTVFPTIEDSNTEILGANQDGTDDVPSTTAS